MNTSLNIVRVLMTSCNGVIRRFPLVIARLAISKLRANLSAPRNRVTPPSIATKAAK
uniref:Secreted protein n=1 Tax=Ascaris lumbricoides TaxID=6252 RepID=A0A0M3IKA1_ASCLU